MEHIIHLANVMYLISYSVRDILWLRVLTVVAACCLLPYFYVQPVPLYAAIAWNALFIFINLYQIYRLFLERRPVNLDPDELTLYRSAFAALKPREFVELVRAGEWIDVDQGSVIVRHGEELRALSVIFSGHAKVEKNGATVTELKNGQFIGEMSFLTGQKPLADVIAAEKTRLVSWPKEKLETFLKERSSTRSALQFLIGSDLVGKLRAA